MRYDDDDDAPATHAGMTSTHHILASRNKPFIRALFSEKKNVYYNSRTFKCSDLSLSLLITVLYVYFIEVSITVYSTTNHWQGLPAHGPTYVPATFVPVS
jgi:hypothetical protein